MLITIKLSALEKEMLGSVQEQEHPLHPEQPQNGDTDAVMMVDADSMDEESLQEAVGILGKLEVRQGRSRCTSCKSAYSYA